MNSSGQVQTTPQDLRNVVAEILQSTEFRDQLRSSIESASSSRVNNATASATSLQTSTRIPVSSPAEELRRLFPSIRGSDREVPSRNLSNAVQPANPVGHKKRKKPKHNSTVLSDFKRDVILLTKPECTRTLTGLKKGWAYANGYGVTAATFQKIWTEQEIMHYISTLFAEKLHGCDVKFEILIPFGGTLVKPNLAQGTVLDGAVMCHLFAQKTVYVRCLSSIDDDHTRDNEINERSDRVQLFVSENHHSLEDDIIFCDDTGVDTQFYQSFCDDTEGGPQTSPKQTADSPDNFTSIVEQSFDEIFEHDTTLAIARSVAEKTIEETAEETLLSTLKQFHNKIDQDTTFQFNVFREDIFNCFIRGVRRKQFSPCKRISVLFTDIDNVSEGAVDMGGPTREMFRLLLKHLKNSTLFEGSEHSKNISLCSEHIDNRHYYEAGRMIVLSLMHGGPGPQFLSETLFNYISNGIEATKPSVDEIMNPEIKEELENIKNAPNLIELKRAVWSSTFLSIAGFANISNFTKKENILECAPKHYLIYRTMPALEQFKEGLNILGFLEKLKVFKEFKELMCYTDSKLTANKVSSIFTTKLSESGSNNRNIECKILTFWNDYLCDSEENETQATLEDVLCFATASEKVPPLGYDGQPKLEFLHNEDFLWPKANTCVPILYLPVSYKSNEYEKFKSNMDYAILNGMQFGFA
uniref:HECT domain-containing protein n=2 Tax=Photinus pyralis TaxID=7054 RepID=A0A1Y1L2Q7_PHOPY